MGRAAVPSPVPFSERGFYLQEFRGRTLIIAGMGRVLRRGHGLGAVVRELAEHGSRVVVVSTGRAALAEAAATVLPATTPSFEASVWRALRQTPRLGVLVRPGRPFARTCREIALRLQVSKLVWIDPGGGLLDRRGRRRSFVHREGLRALLSGGHPRRALLREVEALLIGGIAAVNVCTLEGLDQELFTYAGSGTLFTLQRYATVRRLGIDDFDAAHDLFARGVAEGFLAPRPAAEVDRVLASGFGAFVEGRHLAGIAALLVHGRARAGEIASLYTLTRFLGEGIGRDLMAFALERARELGLRRVFACTTSERVGAFFERQGFDRVRPGELPKSKWRGYDVARRRRLRCYAYPAGSA